MAFKTNSNGNFNGRSNRMKQYCGNGKIVSGKFGSSMLFKLSERDVAVVNQQLSVNKTKGVNRVDIYISKRKETSQYGDTHYGEVSQDTKPFSKEGQASQSGDGGQYQRYGNQASSPSQVANGNGHRYGDEDLPPKQEIADSGF